MRSLDAREGVREKEDGRGKGGDTSEKGQE